MSLFHFRVLTGQRDDNGKWIAWYFEPDGQRMQSPDFDSREEAEAEASRVAEAFKSVAVSKGLRIVDERKERIQ